MQGLRITPVPSGVVATEGPTAFTIKTNVNVFVITGDRNQEVIGKIMSSLNDVAYCLDKVDPSPSMRTLIERQKKAMEDQLIEMHTPNFTRTKRGILDPVGKAAAGLFGLATEGEINELREGQRLLAGAVEGIIAHGKKITVVVNKLGRQQQLIGRKVNEIRSELLRHKNIMLQLVQKQNSILRALDHQYELIRLQTYMSVIRQQVSQIQGIINQDHTRLVACQSQVVNEDLLSLELLEQILGRSENEIKLPSRNYYQYIMVTGMFKDQFDRYVCKLTVPLINAELYKTFKINTYPIPGPNGQFLRVYHDTQVAVGTLRENTFFPQSCVGYSNLICHPGVIEPRTANPCLHGLLSKDHTQQKLCPATYHRQFVNPHDINEVSLNRYVVYTPEVTYHHRCAGQAPSSGQLMAGLYAIEIDGGCVIDANFWELHGIVEIGFHPKYLSKTITPINITFLENIQWHKLINISFGNGVDRLDLPTWEDLPESSFGDGSLINQLDDIKKKWATGSWWKKWYLWVGLIVLLGVLGFVIYFKCVRPRHTKNSASKPRIFMAGPTAAPVEPSVQWSKSDPEKVTTKRKSLCDQEMNTTVTITNEDN